MARTKQTVRKFTEGKAPRKQLATKVNVRAERAKKLGKASCPKATATEVSAETSPILRNKPNFEAQLCPDTGILENSFTGIKGIPYLTSIVAEAESKSSDSDSARESFTPKKLMGDAIRTGRERFKGVDSRFKTVAMKKRQLTFHEKSKHSMTSKRPQHEDMSKKICSMLRRTHEFDFYCAYPTPSPFLNSSADAAIPSRMDIEIHNISDNSDSNRDECEEAADQRPPILQTQNSGNIFLELGPIVTETPMEIAEQNTRDIPENAHSSSANPAFGAVPSVHSSPRGDKKLFIHSLKDGLLGCPLEALQALAPEDYLQGGVGKTTPDQFADILMHHQIVHAVKSAVLYREYRGHQFKYPQEIAQMRTQLRSLDFEVARLKPYEVEVEKLKDLLATKVVDYDNLASQLIEKTDKCSRLLVQQERTDAQLVEKHKDCAFLRAQLDQIETQLANAETQCVDLQAKLTIAEIQKNENEATLVGTEAQFSNLKAKLLAVETELSIEKKEAEEDFNAILRKLEEYEGKYFRLRKRYHHYKAKAVRFLKQLSFTTWYRDQSWVRGFRWGFESFRTIALNPSIFKVDLHTVLAGYLPPPEQATKDLHDLGKDLFPDVLRWTDDQADYPEDPSLPSVPSDNYDSDSDDYAPDA